MRYLAPDFFAVHPVLARGQEEDSLLFDPGFHSTSAEALMNLPGFTSWLESIDHREPYREYSDLIRLLLWQRPGPARAEWGYAVVEVLGADAVVTPLSVPGATIRVADLLP